MTHHLAQLNIAVPRFPTDDPRMDGFMSALDEINALADRSPGFVWRLVGEGSNDATELRADLDGQEQMVNLAVWEDVESVWNYVYRSDHLDYLRQRREWFEAPAGPVIVCWWVPAGELPTVEEGMERLALLREHGPTPEAFTFRDRFDPPTA